MPRVRTVFLPEAKCLARFFGMPGIVAVKDFFTENDTAYIVMEYVEGVTLKAALAASGGRMPDAHVPEIMKPLVRSLANMHKAGILHRDIAPDNIMLQPDGSVKLLDFGAAKDMIGGGQSTTAIIKHGYAPEEQTVVLTPAIAKAGDVVPPTAIRSAADERAAAYNTGAERTRTANRCHAANKGFEAANRRACKKRRAARGRKRNRRQPARVRASRKGHKATGRCVTRRALAGGFAFAARGACRGA